MSTASPQPDPVLAQIDTTSHLAELLRIREQHRDQWTAQREAAALTRIAVLKGAELRRAANDTRRLAQSLDPDEAYLEGLAHAVAVLEAHDYAATRNVERPFGLAYLADPGA